MKNFSFKTLDMKKKIILGILGLGIVGLIAFPAIKKMRCAHASYTRVGFVSATCNQEGNTGDLVCLDCNAKLEKSVTIPTRDHIIELRNVITSSCKEKGYSGDEFCKLCDAALEKGKEVEKTDHLHTEIRDAIDATFTSEGYTGDTYCKDCGELIEKGEATEALSPIVVYNGNGSAEDEIVYLINANREAAGLPALIVDNSLYEGTRVRASELAYWVQTGYGPDPHTRPDGTSYETAIPYSGYMCENLAYYPTPAEVVGFWMNHWSHRVVLMDSSYTYVTIAAVYDNGSYCTSAIFH